MEALILVVGLGARFWNEPDRAPHRWLFRL
jgi:hypothetical protein